MLATAWTRQLVPSNNSRARPLARHRGASAAARAPAAAAATERSPPPAATCGAPTRRRPPPHRWAGSRAAGSRRRHAPGGLLLRRFSERRPLPLRPPGLAASGCGNSSGARSRCCKMVGRSALLSQRRGRSEVQAGDSLAHIEAVVPRSAAAGRRRASVASAAAVTGASGCQWRSPRPTPFGGRAESLQSHRYHHHRGAGTPPGTHASLVAR